MTGEPESPPPFVYEKRSKNALQQRLRLYQFDDDLIRAHRGDTKAICDYLRSDLPLSQEQRDAVADLVYRFIERKQRGRPRGSGLVPNPAREAESLIVYEVRRLKLRMFGDKSVPRGKLTELIKQVIKGNADRFDGVGDISIANVRNELRRGARRKHARGNN